ncbi:MAG: hypothetical protein SFX73_11205 [Kofleriaceae bacterium]|nr:hypothetical protein [Kofleriaceae bacterium]
MKPTTKSLLALALVAAASGVASAQGYYGNAGQNPRLPGGFHDRQGRMIFGFSLGLGGMSASGEDLECANCDYSPLAGQASGHLGGFIGPRLALMGEIQGNVQTLAVDAYGDSEMLVQSALLFAAQYWVTPQLWIKGGLGFSNLRVDHTYYGTVAEVPENGVAVMGAIGYELLSAQRFSVDLQGRLINGSYDSVGENVSSGSIGIGINWF